MSRPLRLPFRPLSWRPSISSELVIHQLLKDGHTITEIVEAAMASLYPPVTTEPREKRRRLMAIAKHSPERLIAGLTQDEYRRIIDEYLKTT